MCIFWNFGNKMNFILLLFKKILNFYFLNNTVKIKLNKKKLF
jgi:hypothetical protein